MASYCDLNKCIRMPKLALPLCWIRMISWDNTFDCLQRHNLAEFYLTIRKITFKILLKGVS